MIPVRHILSSLCLLLCAVAQAQSPDTTASFCQPLTEEVPVYFDLSRNDVVQVTVSLAKADGGAPDVYSVTAGSEGFEPGEYSILVKPGQYEGISTLCSTAFAVDFARDTSAVLEIAEGIPLHLGDLSTGDRRVHYDLTDKTPIYGMWEMFRNSRYIPFLAKATGYRETTVSRILKTMVNLSYHSIKDKTVNAYSFNYTSADVEGRPVTLSAKLYIPDEAFSEENKLRGLILNSSTTITKNDEAPTNAEQVESAMAWRGYAVVMPDSYGFGTSAALPQSFLNTQLAGRNTLDAVKAARQVIKDMGIPCEDMLVNGGYSMGGTNGMATQKYAVEHPEEGIVFNKTFLGGGAYDFNLCFDVFLSGGYPEAGRFIVLSAIGLNETENLGIDYANVFKEPLLSNYEEWILSKKYDIYEIMDFMGNPKSVTDYLVDGMIDKSSPEFAVFSKAMAAHDLTVGFTVPDETEMYVLHSTTDNFVPYENFERLRQSVSGKNVHFISGDYGGHIKASLKVSGLLMKSLK